MPPIRPNQPVVVAARIAAGIPGTGLKAVIVGASVNDQKLAATLPAGFDGLERPFALLPTQSGEWTKKYLDYSYPANNNNGGFVHTANDNFWGEVFVSEGDAKAIAEQGVAFGVDTNRGTVWLQESGNNLIPDPE